MADVEISYKGSKIVEMSASGTKTLETAGTYCEDDLELKYTSPGGGGSTLITKNISANGTYNASSDSADGYSQVTVAVPASAVDSGTKNINTNGTHDVIGYASASVSVPNSYSAGDEGKVVSNGALVAQTSDTVTTNDTYDTTLINSLTVNVSGGGGSSAISLLDTITVPSNTRAVNVDLSDYQDYNFFFVYIDIEIPSGDWLYVVKNGSSESGGNYGQSAVNHTGIAAMQINIPPTADGVQSGTRARANFSLTSGAMTNLYLYAYTVSKYIKAGSIIKVYGGNYADM